MAALVCDICGGKLLMGTGGVATCDSCGMEHSTERMKEKIQEIKGTVVIDSTPMIDNYLQMAQAAKDAGNNSEAEAYCNKIIEIDPAHHKAWFLKGQAAAWQSTLQNSRVDEGVSAFAKAITNAPEDEKEDLVETAKSEIKSLSIAMISLRAERFAKWPDKEETAGFISDITNIIKTITNFLVQTNVLVPIEELMEPIATQINQSVVKAWQDVVWPDYNGDPNDSDDRANKYEWQKFIERVGNCTTLVEQAINICDEDDESDIQRYENLIFMHEKAIESCSWDYDYVNGSKIWRKDWTLTEEAKKNRRTLITQYKAKIAGIKAKITAQKVAAVQSAYKNKSAEDLLAAAASKLTGKNFLEARAIYELVIEKLPNEKVGYLGKAVASVCEDGDITYSKLFAPIITSKDKNRSPEYDASINKLIDYPCGEQGLTLLSYACGDYNLDVVKILIDLGANINAPSKQKTTPLWFICHKELPANKAVAGRQIAKLLLDLGASAEVTNEGGVALFNKKTDSEISTMITAKYPNLQKGAAAGSNGCYVATAVYGSYDCPEVWTLRRYRDYTLAESWYGRAFIRTYYAISPTLVKWFGHTNWFKKMWQSKLDHMVAELQEKGVESTPYEDRNW